MNKKIFFIGILCIITILIISSYFALSNMSKSYKVFPKEYKVYELENYERFTPKKSDITKYNGIIEEFISSKKEVRELTDYNVQYFGFIDENGHKNILGNYICKENQDIGWTKDLFLVLDGGNCYFNLKVDLDQSNVFDFQVNK